jgi:hypothetical protein
MRYSGPKRSRNHILKLKLKAFNLKQFKTNSKLMETLTSTKITLSKSNNLKDVLIPSLNVSIEYMCVCG